MSNDTPSESQLNMELLMHSLKEIKGMQVVQAEQIVACRIDIATLKVKSGIWGSIGAIVTVTLIWFAEFIISKGQH